MQTADCKTLRSYPRANSLCSKRTIPEWPKADILDLDQQPLRSDGDHVLSIAFTPTGKVDIV